MSETSLVKTRKFQNSTYLGDVINTIKIFNEKEVDEIVLLDITATKNGTRQDLGFIQEIASECFVPLGFGGGINDAKYAEQILRRGIEKVVINSHLAQDIDILTDLAGSVGAQSVVASIDVKKNLFGKSSVVTHNGKKKLGQTISDFARKCEDKGAGEILITDVDREGTMNGFNLELIEAAASSVSLPVIANGGAGSQDDFAEACQAGAAAVSAGAMFVFQGPFKALLPSYPPNKQLDVLFDFSAPVQRDRNGWA